MVKRSLIALVLVVLLCGGLVGFNLFRSKMIGEFFANMPVPSVAISATKVKPTTWTPEIDAIGTIWAIQGVDVAVETAGRVRSIEFTPNESVEEGELLVQIDDAVERADLISAKAAVERDRSQLERAERLRESGVTAEAQLEAAQTAFAVSESTLARIQAVLDQKAVEAPFAGIVGIPRIDVGQYVQVGTVIVTLQQLDPMKADFTVPEQQMDSLKMGQPASFGLTEEAFPYEGRIIGIDPKIDPQTRMVSVRAELQNPDGNLKPGQFVRVRVGLPPVANVIALPQTAVVTSLYGDYVYVVESATSDNAAATSGAGAAPEGSEATLRESLPAEGQAAAPGEKLVAKQVFVKIGRRQGNLIEIASGLTPGQTVVTSGQNKLANNTPVTINNSVDPAKVAVDGGDGKP